MDQSLSYIQRHYSVPAEVGRRVEVDGDPGTITGGRDAYILVNFDRHRASHSVPCHPVWRVVYGEMGSVRRLTRAQQRYSDFLNADSGATFAEWIGAQRN